MSLKSIIEVSDTLTTTSTGWQTICSYTFTADCSFLLFPVWVNGRKSTTTATAVGTHRGRVLSGFLSLTGVLTTLQGFSVVSSTDQFRVVESGSLLLLQVNPSSALSTEWYGGFTIILN